MVPVFLAAIAALSLTFWNDSNISRNRKQLAPLLSELVHASCEPSDVNNGRLVYITCELNSGSTFYAPKEFSSNIYSYDGPFFETRVEMFQWVSVPGFFGGYKVGKFVDHIVDTNTLGISLFRQYKNPTFFPHVPGAGRRYPAKLKVGGYTVPKVAFVTLRRQNQVPLTDDRWYQPSPITYPLPVADVSHLNTQVHENALYTGDPLNPKIGDLKITFWGNNATKFSVIGRQSSSVFPREYLLEPFLVSDNNIILLQEDVVSPKALLSEFFDQYETPCFISWSLRLSSCALLAAGIFIHYYGMRAPKSNSTLAICSVSASLSLFCLCECLLWLTTKIYTSLFLALLALGLSTVTISTWRLDPILVEHGQPSDGGYIALRGSFDSVRWSTASPTASIALSSDRPLISARNL